MALPDVSVQAEFTVAGTDAFVFDDPTRAQFDSGGFFTGDAYTDLSDYLRAGSISIRRGRNHKLDDMPAGQGTIPLEDLDRSFDTENENSPFAADLGPGRVVAIESHGVRIYTGVTSSFQRTEVQNQEAVPVSMTVEDELAVLARRRFREWTTTAGQTAGERINDVLDRSEVGVSAEGRDIDSGVAILQADPVSYGSNVLAYLNKVAQSDLGRLFADRFGILRYRDRMAVISALPIGAVSDEDIELSRDVVSQGDLTTDPPLSVRDQAYATPGPGIVLVDGEYLIVKTDSITVLLGVGDSFLPLPVTNALFTIDATDYADGFFSVSTGAAVGIWSGVDFRTNDTDLFQTNHLGQARLRSTA